ncbi:MAG TPA: formyltetrahydrofolate deformylase [Polyangia bacterium]|nr:formyltetrahydrofolate deformylase [Polyangia bacterium]
MTASAIPQTAVLRLLCPDRPGLVARVSGLLYELGANILHADQHIDPEANVFFQRVEFALPPAADKEEIQRRLASACTDWGMRWSFRYRGERPRMAILASRRGHCVFDLLARHRAGELGGEVCFVASNHRDLAEEVERRGYVFLHEAIVDGDRADQERRLIEHLERERIELVVLARYMQILSTGFVARWPERIINIHHSFLPAFPGADPYRRAYRRGVKLIGATSHYVTTDLDEGPIIAQEVTPVSHRDTVEDMERKGRELEQRVLARAVRGHLEERIISYGNRTVVFD